MPLLQHKGLWTVLSIGTSLVFCSGHMWNQIRGAPYSGGKPGEFIAAGFGNQFQVETQLLTFLYLAIAVSLVFLIKRPPMCESETSKRMTAFFAFACFWGFYSLLTALFKAKLGQYPFAVPPFA